LNNNFSKCPINSSGRAAKVRNSKTITEQHYIDGDGGDFKPQIKSGWGLGGAGGPNAAGGNQQSYLGMQRKNQAAQYWDNKTTELVIPEMEADLGGDGDF
jgi:hypothetical protein